MAISEVIEFHGASDDLVWKYRGPDDFNVTSQLIVDDTHRAVLVVNGQCADQFGGGRHTLSVPNIPLLKKIISIPTDGVSPFKCKVFYVTKVHQMDMLWGTDGAIQLNDPIENILLHIKLHGNMSFSIVDITKFLIKLVGFRDNFKNDELIKSFRGIISSHVKDQIAKIMIREKMGYFEISASLLEVSGKVKDVLSEIFDEYGVKIENFYIEDIHIPKEDYDQISAAKQRAASRNIEGFTWKEQREMEVAETFAGNEGTLGAVGGAVGGFMAGGVLGGAITNITSGAINNGGMQQNMQNQNAYQQQQPPQQQQQQSPQQQQGAFCIHCGSSLVPGAAFCAFCGKKQTVPNVCPKCGKPIKEDQLFCPFCGTSLKNE